MSSREELFLRLSADLANVRPELRGFVLCPLCLRPFAQSALNSQVEDRLTIEHPIPASIGGTMETLTCRDCNNTHGSELDGNFVRMVRAYDSLEGDGEPLRGTVTVGNIELPMKVNWSAGDKPNEIQILGGRSQELQAFRSAMASLGDGSAIQLQFTLGFIQSNARRALLRMGYLALFDHLGYRYVVSAAAAYVRKLINGADGDQVARFLFEACNVEEENVSIPVVICPVSDGETVLAYLVLLRIKAQRLRHHCVLLPSPIVQEASMLAVVSAVASQLDKKGLSLLVRPSN